MSVANQSVADLHSLAPGNRFSPIIGSHNTPDPRLTHIPGPSAIGGRPQSRTPTCLQLSQPDGRWHVCRFQLVADMRVRVLMVVSIRQAAKLPVESLPASILPSGIAPAVTAPVPEGLGQRLEKGLIRKHAPALAHGDV